MKFTIDKKDLLKPIQITHSVVSTKSNLPILSNILIESVGNKLRMTATDLEVGIWSIINAEIVEAGSVTVPAKKFLDIIKELPDSKIKVSVGKNHLVAIECEKCLFKIMGLPKDEFPKLPEFKDKDILKLDQVALKNMLIMTSFAASTDETRYILNGVLFELRNGRLKLVATDGRRLATIEKDVDSSKKLQKKIIIPSKAINELERNLKDEGSVEIVFEDNQVMFSLGDTVVVSRLIDGEFPDYERVIPKKTSNDFNISTGEFLLAAKRAGLFTSHESQAVKFDLIKDKMVVSKQTPELGEAKEEIGVEGYGGKPASAGFNPNYLIDALKNVKYDKVKFELSGSDKPGVIRTEDSFTYIILPMEMN